MFGRLRKRVSSKDSIAREGESGNTSPETGTSDDVDIAGYRSIDADDPNSAHSVPKFPMPPSPTNSNLKTLNNDGDNTALMSASQRKYLAQEWEKLEAARSVCFGVNTIEEAVNIANSIWNDMALEYRPSMRPGRRKMGSGDLAKGIFARRKRQVQFDPNIGVTRAEIVDEMIKAPHGLLCEAVEAYDESLSDAVTPSVTSFVTDSNGNLIPEENMLTRQQALGNRASTGPDQGYTNSVLRAPGELMTFKPGDPVLALRPLPGTDPTDPSPWMDGIAHGVRGRFPGNRVKRAAQQPRDVTFMWMNLPPPGTSATRAAAIPVALTHDITSGGLSGAGHSAAEDDEYIEHGGDDDSDSDVDGNEGSGTDDDFEENEFDSDVFTYGGAAVSVQEVELWDDAGDDIDDCDPTGMEVAAEMSTLDMDLIPLFVSDIVHGSTAESDSTPAVQPRNANVDGHAISGDTTSALTQDTHAMAALQAGAARPHDAGRFSRPASVLDYITVVQGTPPHGADHGQTSGGANTSGVSTIPRATSGDGEDQGQDGDKGEYIVTGDDDDDDSSVNPYPDLNRLGSDGDRHSPDPPGATPTRSMTQRGKRWGRKPLASPPPMRRVRSLPLSPPEFLRMPSHARGFIKRSFRRQSSRKKAARPRSPHGLEKDSGCADAHGDNSTPQSTTEHNSSPGRAWRRTLELRESLSQHNDGGRGSFDAPRGQHAYSDRAFKFLQRCITALERVDAFLVQGLYSDSAQMSTATSLFNSFMNSSTMPADDLSTFEVSTLTAAIKIVFQHAESTLLVPVDDWVNAIRETDPHSSERADFLLTCLELLPWTHRVMAVVLMEHLVTVTKSSSVNGMTAKSIGEVFGPILLRMHDGHSTATDSATSVEVVTALIDQFDAIFVHDSTARQPSADVPVVLRGMRSSSAAHGQRQTGKGTPTAAGARHSIVFDAEGNVVRGAPDVAGATSSASSSSDPRRTSVYDGFGELLDVSEDGSMGFPEHMVDLYDSDHAGAYDEYMAIGAVPEDDIAETTPTPTTPIGTLTRRGDSELTGQHLARRASQESTRGFAGLDVSDDSSDGEGAEMEWRDESGGRHIRGARKGSVYGFDVPTTSSGGC